ncbi:MAG TPA: hypothetical protein VEY91_02015, partial [Candidatus Limnocylindria bacterium]|nr:hypothetical protein [Candidatus Limnocylindria bacterium]
MRRVVPRAAALLAAAALCFGCGAPFKLPNEVDRGRPIPSDESYQMIATWTGMTGVNDILLASQGIGSQLFILFKREGTGTASRGEV